MTPKNLEPTASPDESPKDVMKSRLEHPPWTVTLWVQRKTDIGESPLPGKGTDALKTELWNSGHPGGVATLDTVNQLFSYTSPIGQRVHLTFVGTSTDTKLYVNGKYQSVLEFAVDRPIEWLGLNTQEIAKAAMSSDSLEIFAEAMSEQQVGQLYAQSTKR